jgi:hypothetical protein
VVEAITLALPAPVRAAAADAARVWCALEGRLLAYDPGGSPLLEAAAPPGLVGLVAAPGALVAVLEPGTVAWLDPDSGREQQRRLLGGELSVAAGDGGVWVVDRGTAQAWRLTGPGQLDEPVPLGSVDRFAAQGDRLWWTSPHDTLLRGGTRPVDLQVGGDKRGGMAAAAGSVWISVPGGLLVVRAWAAQLGPPLKAPEGPVRQLAAGGGVLVGGSGRRGLFVLDPSVDADVRHLDVELGGELELLIATRSTAWAFPSGRAEARLVALRPGQPS